MSFLMQILHQTEQELKLRRLSYQLWVIFGVLCLLNIIQDAVKAEGCLHLLYIFFLYFDLFQFLSFLGSFLLFNLFILFFIQLLKALLESVRVILILLFLLIELLQLIAIPLLDRRVLDCLKSLQLFLR